jgi:hypothetical protein
MLFFTNIVKKIGKSKWKLSARAQVGMKLFLRLSASILLSKLAKFASFDNLW